MYPLFTRLCGTGNPTENGIFGRRKHPDYHRVIIPELKFYVRVGGTNVTADLYLNHRFKSVPVSGSISFPPAKQDSRNSKNCIFQLFGIDFERSPLDSKC